MLPQHLPHLLDADPLPRLRRALGLALAPALGGPHDRSRVLRVLRLLHLERARQVGSSGWWWGCVGGWRVGGEVWRGCGVEGGRVEGGNALHNAGGSGSPVLCSLGPPASWRGPGRLERFSNSKGDSVPPSAIKLKRTETTLDLSQKAEKGMMAPARPGDPVRSPACAGPAALWAGDFPLPFAPSPIPARAPSFSPRILLPTRLLVGWRRGRGRARTGARAGRPRRRRARRGFRGPGNGAGSRVWERGRPVHAPPSPAASPPPPAPPRPRRSEPVGACTPSDGGGSQVVRVRF